MVGVRTHERIRRSSRLHAMVHVAALAAIAVSSTTIHGLPFAGAAAGLTAASAPGSVQSPATPRSTGASALANESPQITSQATTESWLRRKLQVPLTDLNVTVYGHKEGAPSDVEALAQTPDGFLWLGSSKGLVRFDGVTFMPFEQASGIVTTLTVDAQGYLWVGYRLGGTGRLRNGIYQDVSTGLPKGRTIRHFVIDAHGTLWAATTDGLYHLERERWVRAGITEGFGHVPVHVEIRETSSHALIVSEDASTWIRGPSDADFRPAALGELVESEFGVPAERMPQEIVDIFKGDLPHSTAALRVDPNGAIWTANPLLLRFRSVPNDKVAGWTIDRWPDPAALPGSAGLFKRVQTVNSSTFIDREGNVWVGTLDGLMRFRANKLRSVAPGLALLAPAMDRNIDGSVWVAASQYGAIYRATHGFAQEWDSSQRSVQVIRADRAGNVWLFNNKFHIPFQNNVIERIDPTGTLTKVPYPSEVKNGVSAWIDDPSGGYLFATPSGMFRWINGNWVVGSGRSALPTKSPFRLIADSRGGVWLTYSDNRVSYLTAQGVTNYTAREGLDIGNIFAASVRGNEVWVGGDRGVAKLVQGRFVRLGGEVGARLRGVTGMVESEAGDLWVNCDAGLYHLAAVNWNAALLGEARAFTAIHVYDEEDGLQGGNIDFIPGPTMVDDGEGRIFAARLAGASWIDPRQAFNNTQVPEVFVETIQADGRRLALGQWPRLQARTHAIRIDYTATALSRPEQVTFKYRLDGVDSSWQVAGGRRSAYYADLPPGNYTFHVMASNEDGISSIREGVAHFSVAPAFYQTWWFRAGYIGVAALLLWLIFRLRVRQLQSRLRLELRAKHEERDRIARELHDTLMQGMHGLVLKLQVWSDDPSIDAKHRRSMEGAADATRNLLTEGRDKIVALRSSSDESSDLLERFEQVGHECLSLKPGVNVLVQQAGQRRSLALDAAEEIFQIGREALRNAFMHANAQTVSVNIDYGVADLNLRISDDGDGLPPEVLGKGALPGHWGMLGMKERAKNLSGKLVLSSGRLKGTTVQLTVPGKTAYAN